jgi:hypothetical protein
MDETPSKKPRYGYLSSRMIVECHPGDGQEPLHLFKWWKRIFALVGPPHSERVRLRLLCNMFNASLPPGLGTGEYKGHVFTEYPHPNHPSLESLITRCHQLHDEDPRRAPTIIFIKEGDYEVERYLVIKYPMKIVGAGRDKTTIHGGFVIKGTNKEKKRVDMQGMTMKGSSGFGLYNDNGLSFLCKDLTFTQCGYYGVVALNTKGRLINCVITQCRYSGIVSSRNALIELEGDQTKVDGNGTSGSSFHYGLETSSTSSIIHLLFPLTQESVSTNNHGGRNYRADRGTIETVDTLTLFDEE